MEPESGEIGPYFRREAYQKTSDILEMEELRGGSVTRVLREIGRGSPFEEIAPEDLDSAIQWLRAWGSLGAVLDKFIEELDPELISGEFHGSSDSIGTVLSDAHERIAFYLEKNW